MNADALSRLPETHPAGAQETTMPADGITTAAVELDEHPPQLSYDWVMEQQADPDLQTAKRYVEQGLHPRTLGHHNLTTGAARLLKQYKRLCVHEGVLCRKLIDPNTHESILQIVCPDSKRHEVWRQHHEAAAHAGAGRIMPSLRRRFFWVDMVVLARGAGFPVWVRCLQPAEGQDHPTGSPNAG